MPSPSSHLCPTPRPTHSDRHRGLPTVTGTGVGPELISLNGISAGYDHHHVLTDVSFHIPAGAVVGLLGRTGSGKSTLIRLLFRLYDVTGGSIKIGDHALPEYQLASLRSRVGLVTQDVQLFYATVRDNLTFFNRDISDDKLLDALRTLGLERWLSQQPQGLDTLLAANGAVSAGEAQLIALARVYLKQPQVIILDEASARIDPETEKMLEVALDTVLAGKTTIIIAHRLQTVRRCDYIAILADGQLQEFGGEADLRDRDRDIVSDHAAGDV